MSLELETQTIVLLLESFSNSPTLQPTNMIGIARLRDANLRCCGIKKFYITLFSETHTK